MNNGWEGPLSLKSLPLYRFKRDSLSYLRLLLQITSKLYNFFCHYCSYCRHLRTTRNGPGNSDRTWDESKWWIIWFRLICGWYLRSATQVYLSFDANFFISRCELWTLPRTIRQENKYYQHLHTHYHFTRKMELIYNWNILSCPTIFESLVGVLKRKLLKRTYNYLLLLDTS